MELSLAGQAVLKVIVNYIQTHSVKPGRPETYITYKTIHDILSLPLKGTYGESLRKQGLGDLAYWVKQNNLPAITGLVIGQDNYEPGKGYFGYYEIKDEDKYQWWENEVKKSLEFNWESYLSPPQEKVTVSETPQAVDLAEPPETVRALCQTYRILRDTILARRIKLLYQYECQICGTAIQLQNGQLYAEAHHIKPLGSPHNGPDVLENILCVCPNHHVQLDYGAIKLDKQELKMLSEHHIGDEYLAYHNTEIFNKGQEVI